MRSAWWRKGLGWLTALVLLVSLVPAGAAAGDGSQSERLEQPAQGGGAAEVMPNQLLVRFKEGVLPQHMASSLQAVGASEIGALFEGAEKGLRLIQVRDMAAALPRLQADPQVLYAEPNRVRSVVGSPNDPMYSQQWGLQRVHGEDAWATMSSPNATPVNLAIVDTGIDDTHEDLKGRVLMPGFNALDGSANTHDGYGHGTHVSGIAAAVTDNAIGIAGVAGQANVQLMPVKVLGDDGSGSDFSVARGIKWAADHGAQVIRMRGSQGPIIADITGSGALL